jgi:glucosylceramidase
LFHTLFDPESGLNVCRLCIGASDYSRTAYTYDDGPPDPDLLRFSIDHDRDCILPSLRAARAVNPNLFLLGTPWSPPAWMKMNNSLLGGSMRKKYFSEYAQYLVKFLAAYAQAGVPVNALTVQNEVDTDQDGHMPACLWGQEYEMEFVGRHLGPALKAAGLDTQIWLLDHNYSLWGRVLSELEDPAVSQYAEGVAWHGYAGEPSAMNRVHWEHPDKSMYWTEGGPGIHDPRRERDWAQWGTWIASILSNWSRCAVGWNLALDENGRPNIGPFDCAGMLTVHSANNQVTFSGQLLSVLHYARAVRPGGYRIQSAGELAGIAHSAFINTDGSIGVVFANTGAGERITLQSAGQNASIDLPDNSIATCTWMPSAVQ